MLNNRTVTRRLAIVALAAGAVAAVGAPAAVAQAQGQTLFDAQSDSPAKRCRINMWGKRDDGSKGIAQIGVTDAPGGGKALLTSIKDSPGCSVIWPIVKSGAWRSRAFGAVELVYGGDGSPGQVSFHLSGTAADGKTPARSSFTLSLHRQEWKTVVLRPGLAYGGKGQLKLNTVTSMYFSCYGTMSFAIASARLLTDEELPIHAFLRSPISSAQFLCYS